LADADAEAKHRSSRERHSALRRYVYGSESARLLGVDLSDRVLTDIGYFLD
jgi:hypothetical protein